MKNKVRIEPKRLIGIQATGPSSFNPIENSGSKFGDQLWHELIKMLVNADISYLYTGSIARSAFCKLFASYYVEGHR